METDTTPKNPATPSSGSPSTPCSLSSVEDWKPMISPIAKVMLKKGIGALTILREGTYASFTLIPDSEMETEIVVRGRPAEDRIDAKEIEKQRDEAWMYLARIHSIIAAKEEQGEDLLIGSTAFKSCKRFSSYFPENAGGMASPK